MGNSCIPNQNDKLNFGNYHETIKSIKMLAKGEEDQILMSTLKQFIDYYVKSVYKQKLQEILLIEKKNIEDANRKKCNIPSNFNSNADIMMFHIDGISKEMRQINKIYRNIETEKRNLDYQLLQIKEWQKKLKQVLENKRDKIAINMEFQMEKTSSYSNLSAPIKSSLKQKGKSSMDIKSLKQQSQKSHRAFLECKENISSAFRQQQQQQIDKFEAKGIFETEINKMNQILEKKEEIILQLKQQAVQSQNKCIQLSRKCQQYQQELKYKQQYIDTFTKNYENKLNRERQQIKNLQNQIKQLQNKLKDAQQKNKQIQNRFNSTSSQTVFKVHSTTEANSKVEKTDSFMHKICGISPVLFSNNHQIMHHRRDALVQIFSPLSIDRTSILFQYDKITRNHPKNYIQDHQNLFFLGLLSNGTIVGAFSPINYKAEAEIMKNNEKCFLFSIYPCKSPQQKPQYKKMILKQEGFAKYSVNLDQNYLRFGSNQLKILCGSNEGSTSIGVNQKSNIFYCPGQELNGQKFLGISQSKFNFEKYEIHQVQLKEIII